MARAVERKQPAPRKGPVCQVQQAGRTGPCNAPVVKGQFYCERHLRRRDRIRTGA